MDEDIQKRLDKVFSHIETYNREMGGVLISIKNIEKGMGTMCSSIKSMNNNINDAIIHAKTAVPTWVTIIIGFLMAVVGWLSSKAF